MRDLRVPGPARPERFSAGNVSFGWGVAYEISPEEQRLVWNPYLEALARASSLVGSVEPSFGAASLDPPDLLWRWGRSRTGAVIRQARQLIGRADGAGSR